MSVSGHSLRVDWAAEHSRSLKAEVERISLRNCLANAPTAALSNMVPITLIAISCYSIPDSKVMGSLLVMQFAINLIKLTFSRRIQSPDDRRALRLYELVLAMSGAVWGAMLLPLANMGFSDITTSVIFVTLICTIAVTSMAIASQRRFFTAFILGFVATSVPIALAHWDLVGIMPNLALLGFIYILDSMTRASCKQAHAHILGEIENRDLANKLSAALDASEYLANRDSLTGLLNRRAFEDAALKQAFQVGKATPKSIILFDLDHFKSINDRFGHAIGDEVLKQTAAIIQGIDGMAARWGGEEFVILLDDCTIEQARTIAEDVRDRLILQRPLHWHQTMVVQASFGVASWTELNDLQSAIIAADKAMYKVKSSGRNRVSVSKERNERCKDNGVTVPAAEPLLKKVA